MSQLSKYLTHELVTARNKFARAATANNIVNMDAAILVLKPYDDPFTRACWVRESLNYFYFKTKSKNQHNKYTVLKPATFRHAYQRLTDIYSDPVVEGQIFCHCFTAQHYLYSKSSSCLKESLSYTSRSQKCFTRN